ncbi:hypothetical protein PSACC_02582 [Paramicrosporidium saccamoebae]|uniref:Uncharacterized protein n=1 Tax=Paramicrosporidium saccamoebae TaxID=1246581 RepID=A0A2H9TIH5_9FUNG|nr:hypothetical protein PSACC_02582 [Paramicrosporidium saccamoebae]
MSWRVSNDTQALGARVDMTRTSSGSRKSGPPAYSNSYAYKQTHVSTEAKALLATPISSVCPPCRGVLEWRKRFNKYKTLTVPKKCVRCGGRTIKEPYHVACGQCVRKEACCAKCLTARTVWQQALANADQPVVDSEEDAEN